jgi:hypothetical protein
MSQDEQSGNDSVWDQASEFDGSYRNDPYLSSGSIR